MLRPGGTWGHCDVISAADVGDPEAGYLLENCLIVVLNIGIIPPDNQNLVFCTFGSYTATVYLSMRPHSCTEDCF